MKNGNRLFISLLCITFLCTQACKENKTDEVKALSSSNIQEFIENPIQSDGTVDTSKVAKMTFEHTTFDFGTVEEGDQLLHKFTFKNTGKRPLLIGNANSTCGCTVPDWPKEFIPVGESGEIEVKFNTLNKPNKQTKPVRIYANTWPSETIIYVKANVIPKTEE